MIALICAHMLALLAAAGPVRASTLVDPAFFGQHLENYPAFGSICGESGSSCPAPPWGVSSIRLWDSGVTWCTLEPSKGQYNWAPLDRWLRYAATAKGGAAADLVYTFGNPPGWAVGLTGGCLPTQPGIVPDETEWRNFVTALVQHTCSGCAQIKYYEPWNEWDSSWAGTTAQMVSFTHDVAQAAHGQSPGSMVLTPSVSAYDGNCSGAGCKNLENFLQADPAATGDVDIVNVHTYPTNSNNGGSWPEVEVPRQQSLYDWINKVRNSAMQPNGYASHPLCSTEGSWGKNSSWPDYNNDSSNHGQRAFVARYDLALISLGVSRAYWYAYSNPSWGTLWTAPSTLQQGGFTPGGIATNQLEKTGATPGWLSGATLTAPCSKDASSGLWTCDITRPTSYAGRIMWVESGTLSVPTPSGYTTLRPLCGSSQPAPSTLTVTTEPILVDNSGYSGQCQ
ncbi:MAG: hypothetical protein ACJ768_21460 [Gaiellaceae bacterium]